MTRYMITDIIGGEIFGVYTCENEAEVLNVLAQELCYKPDVEACFLIEKVPDFTLVDVAEWCEGRDVSVYDDELILEGANLESFLRWLIDREKS